MANSASSLRMIHLTKDCITDGDGKTDQKVQLSKDFTVLIQLKSIELSKYWTIDQNDMINQKLHKVRVTRLQSVTKLTLTKLWDNKNITTSVQSNVMRNFNGNYE